MSCKSLIISDSWAEENILLMAPGFIPLILRNGVYLPLILAFFSFLDVTQSLNSFLYTGRFLAFDNLFQVRMKYLQAIVVHLNHLSKHVKLLYFDAKTYSHEQFSSSGRSILYRFCMSR